MASLDVILKVTLYVNSSTIERERELGISTYDGAVTPEKLIACSSSFSHTAQLKNSLLYIP
jgi:hypothetical protein